MTEASKIAAGNKTMDDELIEAVARGLEKSLAWDVEKDVYAGETTHEERCAISRAILPIARKHYAEVFAKVADERAATITALQARVDALMAAISWIEPPFVDANTSEAELRQRVGFCVADIARATCGDAT